MFSVMSAIVANHSAAAVKLVAKVGGHAWLPIHDNQCRDSCLVNHSWEHNVDISPDCEVRLYTYYMHLFQANGDQ